ncbi:MAG: hypothetical protein V8S57_02190 [Oscillospiraceae bacterium]
MANERSSGTAFFSSKDEKPVLAGAHDYFVNNVLPSDIKACVRKIKAPTLYVNNHDETFLLVRSGHGTLTVNGLDYRLQAEHARQPRAVSPLPLSAGQGRDA